MVFLVHAQYPFSLAPGSLFVEQCLFTYFKQSVIIFERPEEIAAISRSSFVSNNLIEDESNTKSQIAVIAKDFRISNSLMFDIKSIPKGLFFQANAQNADVFQCSFDTAHSKNGHYAFYVISNVSKVSQINISRILDTWDTGPVVVSPQGYWRLSIISQFTSFRTIFRNSVNPIDRVSVTNCSGRYLVMRQDIDLHFLHCVFSDITLSIRFDFASTEWSIWHDVIIEDCLMLGARFSIPSEFIVGELITTGETISFHLVNDCFKKSFQTLSNHHFCLYICY